MDQSPNTPEKFSAKPEFPVAFSEQPATVPDKKADHSPAIQVVWQWLTYSLWGWSLCALSVLLSGTLAYYMVKNSTDYTFLTYTFAVLVVLLPLAFVADKLYAKREPDQKHGFAAVVMVLNAVIIFLVSLGAAITAVVTLLNLLLDPGSTSTKTTVVLGSLVVAVLGMLLFIRIIKPHRLRQVVALFPTIVVAIAGVTALVAAAGPFRSEFGARSDKLIESNLPTINDAVQSYARSKQRLPDNLAALDFSDKPDAQGLVDKHLVEYRIVNQTEDALSQLQKKTSGTVNVTGLNLSNSNAQSTYELCVTYKRKKGSSSNDEFGRSSYSSSYLSTYNHKAGRQCYTQAAYLNSNY